MVRKVLFGIFWIVGCLVSFPLNGQLPDDFSDEIVIPDLEQPVGITFDATGRGYVWLKRGIIHTFDTLGQVAPEPLIDISEEVGDWGDHGLLGFALDPDYAENGFFYLLYVVDRHHLMHFGSPSYDPSANEFLEATIGRITRYQSDLNDDPKVISGSRKILIGETPQDGFPILMKSHGIGSLAFGKDGTLLASCGEAAHFEGQDIGSNPNTYWEQAIQDGIISERENIGRFRSQLVDNLNGKIVRIDPATGEGISSNPFYDNDNPASAASRVWSLGFRNPFRFIIQPETGSHFPEDGDPGTLLIGDVGGAMWEEVSLAATGGRNFGWPLFEGYDKNWPDYGETMYNLDAPNPLYDQGGCTQEYFQFRDLLQQPTLSGGPTFENPCDPSISIPANIPAFTHTWPLLSWSNKLWNQPARARIGGFDEDGAPTTIAIDDPSAALQGAAFDGYSSIPGCFYTATNFPEEYHDAFFLVDLSGWIRVLTMDENQQFVRIDTFLQTAKGVVDVALNPIDGCLYYAQVYDGEIRKICYGGNPNPIARIEVDTFYGPSPLTVQFDASGSYDPFGLPITYSWDFADATGSTDIAPQHTFTANGSEPESFRVILAVTDSLGGFATDEIIISLNNTPPEVAINSVADSSLYTMTGLTWLPLTAAVTDTEHGPEELTYSWELFFHHNDHYHEEPPDHNKETFALIEPAGCGLELYWYRIRLTVTDASGLTSYDEIEMFPDCGDPFIGIDPFTADVRESTVQLDWESYLEDDVVSYEVERTATYTFQSIGTVEPATGTYQFTDDAPLYGANYYRIKGVKADGRYAYSEPLLISWPPPADLRIFPNPTEGMITLERKEAFSPVIQMDLYTAGGIPVLTRRWEAVPGQSFQQTLLIGNLSPGPYFYRLTDGSETLTGLIEVIR